MVECDQARQNILCLWSVYSLVCLDQVKSRHLNFPPSTTGKWNIKLITHLISSSWKICSWRRFSGSATFLKLEKMIIITNCNTNFLTFRTAVPVGVLSNKSTTYSVRIVVCLRSSLTEVELIGQLCVRFSTNRCRWVWSNLLGCFFLQKFYSKSSLRTQFFNHDYANPGLVGTLILIQ